MKVEEIVTAVAVVGSAGVIGVVVVAVLGAKECVVKPIGCGLERVVVVGIGAGFGSRVRGRVELVTQYGTQGVVRERLVLLLLLLLVRLVCEMVQRKVLRQVLVVVRHVRQSKQRPWRPRATSS